MSSYYHYNGKSSNSFTVIEVIIVLIIAVAIFAECGRAIDKGTNFRTEIGTVTDKGTKRADDVDKYLVYTKDVSGNVHVYEITDSLIAGRFNSSDVYAGIEVGKTYKFKVAGQRVEIFSWYPNIYEYSEVKEETK